MAPIGVFWTSSNASLRRERQTLVAMMYTRRRFLTTVSLGAAANLVRSPRLLAGEEALETTSVRLSRVTPICGAPVYVAEELLRTEGFTDIRYVEPVKGLTPNDAVA